MVPYGAADEAGADSSAADPAFPEFAPYLGQCRFTGCAHVKEKGCAILAAVENGEIAKTRHESYVKLYESVKDVKEWKLTKGGTR